MNAIALSGERLDRCSQPGLARETPLGKRGGIEAHLPHESLQPSQ